jgi:hypothetical protein
MHARKAKILIFWNGWSTSDYDDSSWANLIDIERIKSGLRRLLLTCIEREPHIILALRRSQRLH